MFEQKSLDKIDGDYFNIIIADSQDVTIQSRNTGHYWYLHCAGYPTEEALIIFHKHRFKDGYHQHGHARSLRQAIKSKDTIRSYIKKGTIPFYKVGRQYKFKLSEVDAWVESGQSADADK